MIDRASATLSPYEGDAQVVQLSQVDLFPGVLSVRRPSARPSSSEPTETDLIPPNNDAWRIAIHVKSDSSRVGFAEDPERQRISVVEASEVERAHQSSNARLK